MVRLALTMTAMALALAACGKKQEAAATGEASLTSGSAATAQAPAMPKRKAGLWSQTVTMAEFTQTSRLCLDDATEAKISVVGLQASKTLCAQQSMTPNPTGGWSFNSVCDMGSGGTTTTKGTITGDFNSKYRMEADTSTQGAGALPGMAAELSRAVDLLVYGTDPPGVDA